MQLSPEDRAELLQAIRACAQADSDAQQRERKRGDEALTAQWKAGEEVRSMRKEIEKARADLDLLRRGTSVLRRAKSVARLAAK